MRLYLLVFGSMFCIMAFTACRFLPTTEKAPGLEHRLVNNPRGMNNAEDDPAIKDGLARLVSITHDGVPYVGKEAFKPDEFRAVVDVYLMKEPGRTIYVQPDANAKFSSVVLTLDAIRKNKVLKVGLIVLRSPGSQDSGSFQRFMVDLLPEPKDEIGISKPDPLMLEVSLDIDGKIRLNKEAMGSVNEPERLAAKLTEVFSERARNSVGQRAVTIKSVKSADYQAVAKVINAIKGAGATPIVLQLDDLWE